jgi:WD40 repeat protein
MLYELLTDMQRFLRLSFSVVDQYPLQLYSSLRLCLPSSCLMHPIFAKNQPAWISKLPNPSKDWDPRQHVLEGHKASIEAISFSLDNTHMVSLSTDGNLRVWRLDTGECIREIWTQKHQDSNYYIGISISTNPMWVVTQTEEQLRLWRGDTAELVGEYELPASTTQTPQLSPCARYCAFIDASYHLVLLHLDPVNHLRQAHLDGSKIVLQRKHNSSRLTQLTERFFLSFSCDSRRIAICSIWNLDQSFVWDIASGNCISKCPNKANPRSIDLDHFNETTSVGLCVDRWMVAFRSSYMNSQIKVRWLNSGDLIRTLDGHKGFITTIDLLNNCTILGSSCSHGEIRTWNIETGVCLTLFAAFAGPLNGRISISADYHMACSILGTQTLSITTNAPNRQPISTQTSEDGIVKLILSEDAALAALIFMSGNIQIWDFFTGNCISHPSGGFYYWHEEAGFPWFTANFEYILIPIQQSSATHLLRTTEIWSRRTGQSLGCFTTTMADRNSRLSPHQLPRGQDIAISPNGRHIALVQYDTLHIFQTGIDAPHQIKAPGCIWDIMFSPDSSLLLMASAESRSFDVEDLQNYTERISIYDIDNAQIAGTIRSPRNFLQIVEMSMELAQLILHTRDTAVPSQDRIEIIDMRTKRTIRECDSKEVVIEVAVDRDLKGCAWRQRKVWYTWKICNIWSGESVHLDIYFTPMRVNFNTELSLVSTNMGDIRVDKLEGSIASLDQCDRVGLGLSDDTAWILWNNTKILWLPPAFRPETYDWNTLYVEISGSTVMIGASGEVLFFIFNIGDLLDRAPSFAT